MDNSETLTKAVRTVMRELLKQKITKTIPVSGSVTTITIIVLKSPQNKGTLTDIRTLFCALWSGTLSVIRKLQCQSYRLCSLIQTGQYLY